MAPVSQITTYAELQSAVADWLERGDLNVRVPLFIALAEDELKRRVRRKALRATVTIAAQAFPVPVDVAELRSMRLVSGSTTQDRPIVICTPEQLADVRANVGDAPGRPTNAAIVGTEIIFAPTPDQAYSVELTYFEKLTPLSGSNTTNSVLADGKDAYLYGALKHAAPFLQHDERVPVWSALFDSAIEQMNTQREREEFTASLRPVRLPRVWG